MSDISKRLEGTWELVKTEGRPSVPKSEHNPSGYIIYDSAGHVHVQIMFRNDRKRFFSKDSLKTTTDEKAVAYDSYLAYYGTYMTDDLGREAMTRVARSAITHSRIMPHD